MSIDVEKCPWCGCKPSVRKGQRRMSDTLYQKAGEWMWLPGVSCRGKRCRVAPSVEADSLDEAIEIWNDRKA